MKLFTEILKSMPKNEHENQLLKLKLIEFLFLNNLLVDQMSNYYSFNAVSVHPFSPKDTIDLGEEYYTDIPYIGAVFDYTPILVLDGDTVKTVGLSNTFKEIPTKKGNIKHEGHMTLFH